MSKLDGGDMVCALEAVSDRLPFGPFGTIGRFIPGITLQERSKLRSFFADYDLVPSLGGGRTDVEKLLAGGLGGISVLRFQDDLLIFWVFPWIVFDVTVDPSDRSNLR